MGPAAPGGDWHGVGKLRVGEVGPEGGQGSTPLALLMPEHTYAQAAASSKIQPVRYVYSYLLRITANAVCVGPRFAWLCTPRK